MTNTNDSGGKITWKRYYFKTHAIEDYRPLVFNESFPWWCTGHDGMMEEYSIIIACLPEGEPLEKYWDDAYDIEEEEIKSPEEVFCDRRPRPKYYKPLK